jgi:hypothetical protein
MSENNNLDFLEYIEFDADDFDFLNMQQYYLMLLEKHEKERKEACQDYKKYIICPVCLSKILKTASYYHINSKICMKRKLT